MVAAVTMLFATSCKKETIEKDEVKTPKVLSVQLFSGVTSNIEVNGARVYTPCNVYKNDVVHVYAHPGGYTIYNGSSGYNNHRVKVIIDGIIKDDYYCGCIYDKTFTVD